LRAIAAAGYTLRCDRRVIEYAPSVLRAPETSRNSATCVSRVHWKSSRRRNRSLRAVLHLPTHPPDTTQFRAPLYRRRNRLGANSSRKYSFGSDALKVKTVLGPNNGHADPNVFGSVRSPFKRTQPPLGGPYSRRRNWSTTGGEAAGRLTD